jgi:hypothetical protein
MSEQPFNNFGSWADRVAVHNNERKTSSYFNQARIAEGLDSPGRRFAVEPPTVVGATPNPYPRLPSGPWADGPSPGLEPSLGVEIDQHERVGTAQEIERSLSEFATNEGNPLGRGPDRDLAASSALLSQVGGDPALAETSSPVGSAREAARASAPPSVSSPDGVDPALAAHSRLRELMHSGIVRPVVVKRRKL